MSIRLASVPIGATVAPTGGTATSLVLLNADSTSAKAFIGTAGVTPLTRSEIAFEARAPKVNPTSPGGFTQGRSSAKISSPKVLANAARTLNSAKVEFSIDPETTAAELLILKTNLCLLILDSDFDQLWLNQSLD